jgi:CheY-like chemotaxis protein
MASPLKQFDSVIGAKIAQFCWFGKICFHSAGVQAMAEHQKHVLLVEDNDDNASIYQMALEHAGYRVTRAMDGEEALRLVVEVRPHLIIMDISLPKLDGWQVTAAIKQDPALRAIPIVAVTAHAFESDRHKARALGFDGYLPKPVEPRRVLAEVEQLIGSARITA